MAMNVGVMQLAIIALVVFALFGYKKLPDATRAVGRSVRIFKSELDTMKRDNPAASRSSAAVSERDDRIVERHESGDGPQAT